MTSPFRCLTTADIALSLGRRSGQSGLTGKSRKKSQVAAYQDGWIPEGEEARERTIILMELFLMAIRGSECTGGIFGRTRGIRDVATDDRRQTTGDRRQATGDRRAGQTEYGRQTTEEGRRKTDNSSSVK